MKVTIIKYNKKKKNEAKNVIVDLKEHHRSNVNTSLPECLPVPTLSPPPNSSPPLPPIFIHHPLYFSTRRIYRNAGEKI